MDIEVDNNVFWYTRSTPDCTILIIIIIKIPGEHALGPPSPQHESESTSLQGYLLAWQVIFDVKNEKPPFYIFYISLASGGGGGGGGAVTSQTPL